MRGTRRVAVLGLVLGAGALVAGCGDTTTSGEPLPTGSLSIDRDTRVWVDGRTAHVGGTTFELQPKPESFAAGASGLYYLAKGVLYFADDSGSTEIAEVGEASEIHGSADRRYVGYVDFGPDFGARPAEAVVVDTTTGEPVFRTGVGNGDEDDDDLGDLYSESTPTFVGFDDEAGYVVTARSNDAYRLPLGGGEPENVGDGIPEGPTTVFGGERVWIGRDGVRWTITGTGSAEGDGTVDGGSRYPGGAFATANSYGATVFFEVDTGRAVELESDFERLRIGTWTGPTEFLGVGFDGEYAESPTGRSAVVLCSLESRNCETLGRTADYAERGGILFDTGESTTIL
jgi:hypothetical protein